jgi:TonB family protein
MFAGSSRRSTAIAVAAFLMSATPSVGSTAEDDAYVQQVRAILTADAHYPTTKEAQLLQPRGEVEIWFRVSRAGRLVDAGIATSSNNMLLDNQALATVRQAQYPAFGAQDFPGQTLRTFRVSFHYPIAR